MPAPINQMRFVGTGKPMKPELKNLRLLREPSAKGILQSGVDSIREFRQINKLKTKPSPQEIGRNSAKIQRKIPSGKKVDFIV